MPPFDEAHAILGDSDPRFFPPPDEAREVVAKILAPDCGQHATEVADAILTALAPFFSVHTVKALEKEREELRAEIVSQAHGYAATIAELRSPNAEKERAP